MDASSDGILQKCGRCCKKLPLNSYGFKTKRTPNGEIERNTRCKTCVECEAQVRKRKKAEKENPSVHTHPEKQNPDLPLKEVSLPEFLNELSQLDNVSQYRALVDIAQLKGALKSMKDLADSLAEIVWNIINYRFM